MVPPRRGPSPGDRAIASRGGEAPLATVGYDLFYGQAHALKNVTLEIEANGITAIIGRRAAARARCSARSTA
jgi:hypothetical protein